MTVEQLFTLRRQLRKENAEFKVVKNNFAKIVFQNRKAEGVDGYLVGPTAVVIPRKESGPWPRFSWSSPKRFPLLKLKGGYIAGSARSTPRQVGGLTPSSPARTNSSRC